MFRLRSFLGLLLAASCTGVPQMHAATVTQQKVSFSEHDLYASRRDLSPAYQVLVDEAHELIKLHQPSISFESALFTVHDAKIPDGSLGIHYALPHLPEHRIYLNERKLNDYAYGVRRLSILHEMVHHWQACQQEWKLRTEFDKEREADTLALALARCHRCVEECVPLVGAHERMRSAQGYCTKGDCERVQHYYWKQGDVCAHHSDQCSSRELGIKEC